MISFNHQIAEGANNGRQDLQLTALKRGAAGMDGDETWLRNLLFFGGGGGVQVRLLIRN